MLLLKCWEWFDFRNISLVVVWEKDWKEISGDLEVSNIILGKNWSVLELKQYK